MIYFDNAATSFPKPDRVYDYMDKYYRENGASAGRGQYRLASEASLLITETKRELLNLFNCKNKKVVLTSSATIALNMIIQGLEIEDYSNIYISPFEHNAVMKNLYQIKKNKDVNIITLSYDYEKNEYDLEKIKDQFNRSEPKYIIISHASNVTGQLAPAKEIFTIGKKLGSINILDICQTAGLVNLDLSSDIYDYSVFAGHKTLYGPFGASGFICKEDIELKPILFGGTGVDSINLDSEIKSVDDLEIASKNTLSIAGLNASVKWILNLGVDKIRDKDKSDQEKLINILSKYNNIKIIGPLNRDDCIGVISCKFKNFNSLEAGKILEKNNIAVRTGLHCSPYAHKNLKTLPDGTVRFSLGYFNKEEDFIKLEKVLRIIYLNS